MSSNVFGSASGYTSLPNGKFSPDIFSQKVLKSFRKTSVVEDIVNSDFYGEIANHGDTVRVILEPSITISPYLRGTQPATQDLVDNEVTLTVNKANYFQFAIDDLETKQSHVNWEALASNRAAYEIKDEYDGEVLDYIAKNARGGVIDNNTPQHYLGSSWSGSTETVAAVRVAHGVTPSTTAFTPLGVMARAKRVLDVANVPSDNRWCVVDPVFLEELANENSKLLDVSVTGDGKSALRNGKVSEGQIRGFSLYESNNLPVGGSGPDAASGGSTDYGTLIFGHMSAVAAVSQIAKTESFRSPTRFADVVRGLHLYGRTVIRPEALFVVRYAVRAAS